MGIGTASPTQALTVNGNIIATSTADYIGIVDNIHGAVLNRKFSIDDNTYVTPGATQLGYSYGAWSFNAYNGYNFQVGTGGTPIDALSILVSGKIGIQTVGPQSTLSVNGGVAIGTTYAGTNAAGSNNLIVQGKVGIGTTTPSQTLHVSGSLLTTSWTGINFSSTGNVIPTAPLEVSGTIGATYFVGDGSGLTNLGQGDRITSGTASVVANQDTGVSGSAPLECPAPSGW